MKKKFKKGFTLTELIVVIVIIGILAAVLIPTITGYIQKAKLSKEQTNVRNLNLILASEAIFDDIAYYDSTKVIQIAKDNGYNLKSSLDDYSYWYDRNTNKMVLAKDTDTFGSKLSAASSAEERNTIEALSETYPSYLYVDQKESIVLNVIETIKNLPAKAIETTNGMEVEVLEKMQSIYDELLTSAIPTSIKTYVEKFNPETALYVENASIYTRNTETEFTQIVFTEGIDVISSSTGKLSEISCETTINIPSSVLLVEEGGLLSKVVESQKVAAQTTTLFEEGSYVGNIAVTKASTIKLDGSNITINFNQKELQTADGTIYRLPANDESISNIVKQYLIPTISLENNKFVNFGEVDSCIAKSKLAKDFIKIDVAIVSNGKNYKIENIGYVTSIDASITETGRVKINGGDTPNPKAEYINLINIDVNELFFTSKVYENAKIKIDYKAYKQEYSFEEVADEYNRINYVFKYGNKEEVSVNPFEITISEFKEINDLYQYFLEKNNGCNKFEINKIEIIIGEQVLFCQTY